MATLEESLIFGSLFAGIGGFDLGFARAGMHCAWSVEIDDRCNEVRAHHWPDVRQYKDVRDVGRHNLKPVDVICGGFPCQDLSVAGRRAGLAGERSGLWWEFHRIIAELSPRWVIIENVPGLLSSWSPVEPPPSDLHEGQRWETDETSDFDTLITSVAELGYGYAWATLDAQFFGVAQRRRRVFIVGCLGDWRGAPQVLFEPESGCRDSAPSREAGESITQSITRRLGSSGPDDNRAQAQHLVTPTFTNFKHGLRGNASEAGFLIAHALGAHHQRLDHNDETFVVGFSQESDGSTVRNAKDLARPITGRHGDPGVVAFQQNIRDEVRLMGGDGNIAGSLAAQPGMKQQTYLAGFGVRRLTPLEAERLQGFPDTWTAVNGMSDSARYRMLGNAVAVPVAEWIGKRIMEVDYGLP